MSDREIQLYIELYQQTIAERNDQNSLYFAMMGALLTSVAWIFFNAGIA
jgi:ammonia channel protein AmtB